MAGTGPTSRRGAVFNRTMPVTADDLEAALDAVVGTLRPATDRDWSLPAGELECPSGMADPEGFAAMGCVELLVHGNDIAEGLGVTFDPPREPCARTVERLFPTAPVSDDPWRLLLWAAGRDALPGHPRREEWRWHGAPPSHL
jgi:hypothetical protein